MHSMENYDFLWKKRDFSRKITIVPRNIAIVFSTCVTTKTHAKRMVALYAKSALKAKMREMKMRFAVR